MGSNTKDKEFLSEFITLYRNYPCLWKIKSKEYMNKQLKAAAYDALLEKYKEVDDTVNSDFIKRKINSLRSVFRKECKKVKASERSGAGEEDIYVPSLWYYDQLLFLQDQEMARESVSNIDNEELNVEEVNDTNESQEGEEEIVPGTPETPARSRKRKDPSDEILGIVADKLKNPGQKEFENYGKHLAEQLRSLPKDQALHAQKLIIDVMYEASLGTLGRQSKVVAAEENQPGGFAAYSQQYGQNYFAQPHNYSGYTSHSSQY